MPVRYRFGVPLTLLLAQFKVNIRGYTDDDEDLVCMDLMMDFRPKRASFLSW